MSRLSGALFSHFWLFRARVLCIRVCAVSGCRVCVTVRELVEFLRCLSACVSWLCRVCVGSVTCGSAESDSELCVATGWSFAERERCGYGTRVLRERLLAVSTVTERVNEAGTRYKSLCEVGQRTLRHAAHLSRQASLRRWLSPHRCASPATYLWAMGHVPAAASRLLRALRPPYPRPKPPWDKQLRAIVDRITPGRALARTCRTWGARRTPSFWWWACRPGSGLSASWEPPRQA